MDSQGQLVEMNRLPGGNEVGGRREVGTGWEVGVGTGWEVDGRGTRWAWGGHEGYEVGGGYKVGMR